MKWQDAGFNCGPYALHNALEALGIYKTPEELAVLCGTTPQDGTDEKQIRAALVKLGRAPEVIAEREKGGDGAVAMLRWYLLNERPVILVVDFDEKTREGSHWVVARGILGERILVADAAHPVLEPSYTDGELLHRWNCRGRKAYYGIAC